MKRTFKKMAWAGGWLLAPVWPTGAAAQMPNPPAVHAGHGSEDAHRAHAVHDAHAVHGSHASAGHSEAYGGDDGRAGHAAHGTGVTDHADMPPMQGGTAPSDARDPHAYSGGYVRHAGTYALPSSTQLMMADEHRFAALHFDRLEYVRARGQEWLAYEGEAWYGGTYDRAVIKAEGELADGRLRESRTELLWRHAVAAFWDAEAGVRVDHGRGVPNREWLAFGIKGLAPYWFEVDATAYVGSGGRTALKLKAEYDLLLSQRLRLLSSVEVRLHGRDDAPRGVGSGLTDGAAGLRLKYEVTRQLAPYLGVEWSRKFGRTADGARAAGAHAQETRFVAGVGFRF